MRPYPRVLYLSTYVPRKCGIATFTKDLTLALNSLGLPKAQVGILTNEPSFNLSYPKEGRYLIRENAWSDYQSVMEDINLGDEFDVVCIQHEFGIFGKNSGEMIIPFIRGILKPVVTTLHTVLRDPSQQKKRIINQIAKYSKFLVVMSEEGRDILKNVYKISEGKIIVIPHGVPKFDYGNEEEIKKKLNLEGRIVMSSINLVSRVKGLEYAIESLPKIIESIPNFIYQIIGESHPVDLKRSKGRDYYRQKLIKLVKKLKVEDHVRFVDQYVSLEELVDHIRVSDFYITPYLDPQQSTSGALAYALGGGMVCLSTPYTYAKEMLRGGRGVLVPFRDSQSIAREIIRLCQNPSLKRSIEDKVALLGKRMSWENIAKEYLRVFESVLDKDVAGKQSLNSLYIQS